MPRVLFLSLLLIVLNLTLPLLAGIYIVSDLGGSLYLSVYGVSFFCIGNLIGVPLGKPLAVRLNNVEHYTICMLLFCVFSGGCAMAPNYVLYNVFRFLQGAAGGPLFILITNTLLPYAVAEEKSKVQNLMQDESPSFLKKIFYQLFQDDKLFIVLLITCLATAPVFAASFGDCIAFYADWRHLFIFDIPLGLCLLIYVSLKLRGTHLRPDKINFDKLGYFLYVVCALFLGIAATTGQQFDWFRSYWMTFLLLVGGVSGVLFIFRSLKNENPVFDFSLFKDPYFTFGAINLCCFFSIYFGTIILLGQWLNIYVDYTPYWIAILVGVPFLGSWIPFFLNHEKFDPRFPLGVSLLFLFLSSYLSSYFDVDIDFGRIAFSRFLAGFGIILMMPPLFKLVIQHAPAGKKIECVNAFHILRLIGSGFGFSSYIIIWQRRQVFYHERLGGGLTEFSEITTSFLARAKQFNLFHNQPIAQLQVFLDRQATALALEDCFYMMTWVVGILLLLWGATFLSVPYLREKT